MKENNNHLEEERNNRPRRSKTPKQKAGIVMGALAIIGTIIGAIFGPGTDGGSNQA